MRRRGAAHPIAQTPTPTMGVSAVSKKTSCMGKGDGRGGRLVVLS